MWCTCCPACCLAPHHCPAPLLPGRLCRSGMLSASEVADALRSRSVDITDKQAGALGALCCAVRWGALGCCQRSALRAGGMFRQVPGGVAALRQHLACIRRPAHSRMPQAYFHPPCPPPRDVHRCRGPGAPRHHQGRVQGPDHAHGGGRPAVAARGARAAAGTRGRGGARGHPAAEVHGGRGLAAAGGGAAGAWQGRCAGC